MMKNDNIDWGGWILAIFMLWVFWPIGVILLVKQLSKVGRQTGKQTGKQTARVTQTKTATAAKKSKKSKELPGEKLARVLTIVGGFLTGCFGVAILATLGDALAWGDLSYYIGDLFAMSGFFCGGLACLGAGARRRKQVKRFKKYLSYIGRNESISLTALAAAMGEKERKVYDDLQEMLDSGVLPRGYIDLASGRLVLSEEGISDFAEPPKAEEKMPEKDENAILQEIREVNDAIPDEGMSEKIDRIGEITGKILDYQRSHPGKGKELRSFLNYYLPTTLKVLRAYAQLDAQGVEGENITAAKKRIEGMMDQVVAGFEKQLDKLFQDTAMDIASDVEVLENMLRQDGLSGGYMDFGGTSPQQAYVDLKKVAEELDAVTREDEGGMTLGM